MGRIKNEGYFHGEKVFQDSPCIDSSIPPKQTRVPSVVRFVFLTSAPDTDQTALAVLDEQATVKTQTTHLEMIG